MAKRRKLDQYKGRLSPEQVAAGMNAAKRNAANLAADARLLLERGRFPTAMALAILSIEESGKCSILRGLSVAGSDSEVSEGWRSYRSHTRKNVLGGLLDAYHGGARKLGDFFDMFADTAERSQLLDNLKQLGFYTDCLGQSHWSEPSEVIGETVARRAVTTATALATDGEISTKEIELWVTHLGEVWGTAAMSDGLLRWYEDMQRQGLAAPGPNAMRVFIEDGIDGWQPDKRPS
jgi:AbiV family abortive infection protein